MIGRKNPDYPLYHRFTVRRCDKCGEWFEPICALKHICKKQNSYPLDKKEKNNARLPEM